MTQVSQQHTKFRWTENLTCRFIQLRREYGKLFTGRKYSAQAGWECILEHMRAEFPTIMDSVPYRVLKKKWSNLLQQYKAKFIRGSRTDTCESCPTVCLALVLLLCIYHRDLLKELKNPVHGDRNKADDVSWPFYNAIDEVLGHERDTTPINDEYIDPQEFLWVSVRSEEPTSSVDTLPVSTDPEDEQRNNHSFHEGSLRTFGADCEIETKRRGSTDSDRQTLRGKPIKRKRRSVIARLPRATEVTIEKVMAAADCSKDCKRHGNDLNPKGDKQRTANEGNEDEKRPRKSKRTRVAPCQENGESRTDQRIEQIFEYIKRRDEENRCIMVRIMHAVESIANKL